MILNQQASRGVCLSSDTHCHVFVDHSGFGQRGRRRIRREHGDVRRQQLKSFRNPEELPAHLQGALLVQGKFTRLTGVNECSENCGDQ